MGALKSLRRMLREKGEQIAGAIGVDLRRCWLESWSAEPGIALADTNHAIKHLRSWRKDRRYRASPSMIPGRVRGKRNPFGTAVIIGPWNYPAGLLLCPMVSALAAGNSVILKPSERAPATAKIISKLIGEYFPVETAAVVNGGGDVASWLVRNAADIVCFTGSGSTGRKVAADAASKAVPSILELGGVNPCFVDRDADLHQSARRIAWGKFFGAGQTCLAPNHVFAHRDIYNTFLREMKAAVRDFYGDNPHKSPYYSRIIDEAAWDRLEPALNQGKPLIPQSSSRTDLFIPPTILVDIDDNCPLLREEIFGPVLPVIPFDSLEEVVAKTGKGQNAPLAVYGFSAAGKKMENMLLRNTTSGSVSVNGTLHRIVSSSISFGGVGGSGFGRYRGIEGYRAFSWERVTLRKHSTLEMPKLYPPYRIGKNLVKLLARYI